VASVEESVYVATSQSVEPAERLYVYVGQVASVEESVYVATSQSVEPAVEIAYVGYTQD
jgi:hypothetical protein